MAGGSYPDSMKPVNRLLLFMCQLAPREYLACHGTDSNGIARGCMGRTMLSMKSPEGAALAKCQLAPGQNLNRQWTESLA